MSQGAEGSCRVLVVEDEALCRFALTSVLEACGFEVESAGTGEAALDRAGAFAPSWVLLDLGLPDMDGRLVAAELQRRRFSGRVVALTGSALLEETDLAGLDHYLVKPVDVDDLVRLLGCPLRGAGQGSD